MVLLYLQQMAFSPADLSLKQNQAFNLQCNVQFKSIIKLLYLQQWLEFVFCVVPDVTPPPSRVALLMVLWALLVFMVYKVATADHEYQEYDPFEILQLDPVSHTHCDIIMYFSFSCNFPQQM